MGASFPSEDPLVRMHRELKNTLAKGGERIKWVMAIDLARCIGCNACTVACVSENTLPPGVVYRPVTDEELGTYPHVRRRFLPRPCMQCENPPCVSVCPVSATHKNAQGVTVIDYTRCIGCRYCLTACPYGARTSDFAEWYTAGTAEAEGKLVGRKRAAQGYETQPAPEYGKQWPERGKGSPIGNARKCHFCQHRLAVGQLPSCVTSCIGRATFFGNLYDPDALVHELIGSPRVFRLKEQLGTQPNVYYLA
jgi:molybdopterin-containing oxidoreductase family iron-sulfur binding subunit